MSVRFGGKIDTYETLVFLEERVGLGLFVWDLETDDVQWSDGMFALFGMKPGTVEPSTAVCLSMTHPDDRISSGWLRHEAGEGRLLDREFRVVLRDGRVRHLMQRARLVGDSSGSKTVRGVRIDVTPLHEERTHAEVAQRRLRTLMHALRGTVWLARFEGGSFEAFSLSSSEDPSATQGNWFDRIYPEDKAMVLSAWANAVHRHAPFAVNHRFQQPDGNLRWYQSRAAPQLDDHGSPVRKFAARGGSSTGPCAILPMRPPFPSRCFAGSKVSMDLRRAIRPQPVRSGGRWKALASSSSVRRWASQAFVRDECCGRSTCLVASARRTHAVILPCREKRRLDFIKIKARLPKVARNAGRARKSSVRLHPAS